MIVIVDYGCGNLFSLSHAFSFLGKETLVSTNPADLSEADYIVLPGVGAFGDAMQSLQQKQWLEPLRDRIVSGVPTLGICLGMQLLLSGSDEFGGHQGLDVLPGRVRHLRSAFPESTALRVPHVGWRSLDITAMEKDLADLLAGQSFYFSHSYGAFTDKREDCCACVSLSQLVIPAIIKRDNILGVQFHPEKSGQAGLALIDYFMSSKNSGSMT